MMEPQIVHRQGGLTTSEMVVYPMTRFCWSVLLLAFTIQGLTALFPPLLIWG